MSGHSKWATIKHKKGKTDAERGKIFTKIGREITVAVREGGPDPEMNSKLRDIIAKAKANNMPNDNINRVIQKVAGNQDSASYEENTYEGYAVAGVAVLCETLTDNRNRTASDLRHFFDKYGAGLGTSGCVSWMFDKKGLLIIEKNDKIDEDELMMEALEAGAEDVKSEEDSFEIITASDDFAAVRDALEAKGFVFVTAERAMIPQTLIEIGDEETAEKIIKLIDMLEDNDDVQNVYHNAVFTDDAV